MDQIMVNLLMNVKDLKLTAEACAMLSKKALKAAKKNGFILGISIAAVVYTLKKYDERIAAIGNRVGKLEYSNAVIDDNDLFDDEEKK